MARENDPTPQQLAAELAKLVNGGIGRPLRGGPTPDDLHHLASIAAELPVAHDQSLETQIAEVIVPRVRELDEKSQQILAHLLWIEDIECQPDQIGTQPGDRKAVKDRVAEAARIDAHGTEYFSKQRRPKYLEDLARQVLDHYSKHRQNVGKDDEAQELPPQPDSVIGENQPTTRRFDPSAAYEGREVTADDFTKSFFDRKTTYDFIDDLAKLAEGNFPVAVYVGRSFASDVTAPMTDRLMAGSLERWLQADERSLDELDQLSDTERREIVKALRDAYPASYLSSMAREKARELNIDGADPNGDADFAKHISDGIKHGNDPGAFLAHSIGALAFSLKKYGSQPVQVVTTNYHEQIATERGKVHSYFTDLDDCSFDPDDGGHTVPLHNLNGLVSDSNSRGCGQLVIGEADRFVQYDGKSEPSRDIDKDRNRFFYQVLDHSACIFVGSNLSTPDMLAVLAATKYKKPRYAIVQSRELGLIDNEHRTRAVNLAARRFLHLGVVPIFIDFSHQAPQLLIEVALRLRLGKKSYDRKNYKKRLDAWWKEGRKSLGFGGGRTAKGTKRYKELSEIQQVWLDELDKARRRIARTYLQVPTQPETGEREKIQVDVWLREPEPRRLRLWASSDGIFFDASTAPWCYIHQDVDAGSAARAAVQKAFRNGKTVGESVDQPSAGIWAYQMCMPLVLHSDTVQYLPVGVARILSSRGMIEDNKGKWKPDGKLAESSGSADKLQELTEYMNKIVNKLLNRASDVYTEVGS